MNESASSDIECVKYTAVSKQAVTTALITWS